MEDAIKLEEMKIRAIWIIDENYIVPAYVSICSFLVSNKIPILVVYSSILNVEETASLFTSMHPLVRFETFETPSEFLDNPNKGIITNRLARIHYAHSNDDEVQLLLDADTLFSKDSSEFINEISLRLVKGESTIFGVLDARVGYLDNLYMRTEDLSGREVVVPNLTKKDIYNDVFGDNWLHDLKGPSINNGVIAFYNCDDVLTLWKEFYIKGLNHINVNVNDDQLPLAAAIHRISQNVICLDEKYNSKGEVQGEYVIYHAFSNAWKMQLYSAYLQEEHVSDFADIAKTIIPKIPKHLIDDFIHNLSKKEPYLYRRLNGDFRFKHLYDDIVTGLENGIVVEVGINKGKSSCFMIECIRNSGKNIQLHSFRSMNVQHDLSEFIHLINSHNLEHFIEIHDSVGKAPDLKNHDEIDFVFLNLGNDYNEIYTNLEYWFSKLKPGGILAGYDYTSQIGINYGDNCATFDFCENHNLSLRIAFDIFIIEMPTVLENDNDLKMELQESNHHL